MMSAKQLADFTRGTVTNGDVNGDRFRFQRLPKVLLHEHLDCSLRPGSMLSLWSHSDFKFVPKGFPAYTVELWRRGERQGAAKAYQHYLESEATSSLAAYIGAIVNHVLPLMQNAENLTRFTRERIEDAAADGIVVLHLRFAPQLHTAGGLSLSEVMNAVVNGLAAAPIIVKLVLCTLRHESAEMAHRLAELAIEYRKYVALVDLAGDEHAVPGVLEWWVNESIRVREAGLDLTMHLWETDDPQVEDVARLDKFAITRLGHGMRGNQQADRLLEVCPSSNVVTGQVRDFAHHPIDRLFSDGMRVTVNTDGTLFTGSDLTNEYMLLSRHFGWGPAHFKAVNETALEASLLPADEYDRAARLLAAGY